MKFSQIIKSIESDFLKQNIPSFRVGNQVCVNVLIQEVNKKRLQSFQGTIVSQHRAGLNSTISVRRVSKGIGVERIFPIHSPDIESIEKIAPTKKNLKK